MTTSTATKVSVADALRILLPDGLPFRFTAYDGSGWGPEEADIHVHLANQRGLSYMLTAPGDLGLSRAYVAGDLQIEGINLGDPYPLLQMLGNRVHFTRPPVA